MVRDLFGYKHELIFHDALGWVYPVSSGGNGNWLYQSTLGWMWTKQGVYPYLYQNSSSDWILLNNQYYYSSSSSSWSYWGCSHRSKHNASKTYAMGSLARVGQDSFTRLFLPAPLPPIPPTGPTCPWLGRPWACRSKAFLHSRRATS